MFALICAVLLIGFGIYYHNQDKPLTATQYVIGGIVFALFVLSLYYNPPSHHFFRHLIR